MAFLTAGLERRGFRLQPVHLPGQVEQWGAGPQVTGGVMLFTGGTINLQRALRVPGFLLGHAQGEAIDGAPLETFPAGLIGVQLLLIRITDCGTKILDRHPQQEKT